jgi:threonine dehydrogenase-like Zn-dependent dehydrogenase
MKEWGAHVTTACSTDAVELVKRLGADDVIDYKSEDVAKRIKIEPRYDVILDSVGGNLEYFTNNAGRSCSKSTYVTLMPPMLDIIDESGLALGSLRSAGTFFAMALRQVSLYRIEVMASFMITRKNLTTCQQDVFETAL